MLIRNRFQRRKNKWMMRDKHICISPYRRLNNLIGRIQRHINTLYFFFSASHQKSDVIPSQRCLFWICTLNHINYLSTKHMFPSLNKFQAPLLSVLSHFQVPLSGMQYVFLLPSLAVCKFALLSFLPFLKTILKQDVFL